MKSIAVAIPTLLCAVTILLDPVPMAHAEDGEYVASEVVTSYVSGNSPTMILSFDNNLEICLALRKPGSIEDLRERGIAVTRSQLLVLRLWNLIASDESGLMHFTLPVIDASRSLELTALAEVVAEKVLAASRSEVDAFMSAVRDAGWDSSGYVLMGSYVLDGLLWPALERQGLLEESNATEFESGSEYWSGLSWVTLSPVPKALGTNSIATANGTMHAAWTPASLDVQESLLRRERVESVTALTKGLLAEGSSDWESLAALGLVNDDGSPTFPVIDIESSLCKQGGILALRIAQAMSQVTELDEMIGLVGAPSSSAALIMAHHWVYPAILRILETEGISPPPVLEKGSAAGVAASVFVTDPDVDCVGAVQ